MSAGILKRELCGERDPLKKVYKVIRAITDVVLAVLYPSKCPFCGKLTGKKAVTACGGCRKKLPFITGPRCFQCGKPVDTEEKEYCMDCARKKHGFTQGISLWSYDKSVKQAVYRFKYKNQRAYAGYFARELVRQYGTQIRWWNAQAIIPVPIHRKRYGQRGYNQAELLARAISQYMQVPVQNNLIVRIKNTKPQKELNEKERQKNLKSAFKINENGVKLKKVIIVDDIYTTGSTVDVMTELLLSIGVTDVYVITLCIGKGY